MGSYGEIALRKRSNGDKGGAVRRASFVTGGPASGDAPAAVTRVSGSAGSDSRGVGAAPASTTGPAATEPTIRPPGVWLVSSASKVGSPSIFTACSPVRPPGTTADQLTRTKVLTGTLRWPGAASR